MIKIAKRRLEYIIGTRVARTMMILLPNNLIKTMNFQPSKTINFMNRNLDSNEKNAYPKRVQIV